MDEAARSAVVQARTLGLPREQAVRIAGGRTYLVEEIYDGIAPVVAAAANGTAPGDRVAAWFEGIGWELDEAALRSALSMLGADEPEIERLVVEAAERRAGAHRPEPWKGHRWIEIPRWHEFQHPDAARSKVPPWVKNWTRQLSDDDYLSLTFHQRGVLEGIRLEYARALRQLTDSTLSLTRRLGQRVSARDLEALSHAGFIHFSASRPARTPASDHARPDGDGDREPPTPYGDASKTPARERPPKAEPLTCPVANCGIQKRTQQQLDDHLANVHGARP